MSTQETVRQRFDEIEESEALRLDADKAEQIVDALNTDLANAYVMYHQLHKHHWNVEGAEFRDLHLFLQEAYENMEAGADMIAERAQAIGGVPIAGPANQEEHATVEFEGEDVYDIRTSLENDMEAYATIIEGMRDHIQLAANLGDPTTEHILKEILVDIEEDAHHIEHYLEDDTLVVDSATN
ncbi:DNA starvation/stationary phase protection protein DpsA [Halonotius roseus]|uniref:DNA starvation/stationary phase protection protein n=1 Tax=Halonotius roseus TaxID=2511997 RepID=A0A544QQ83_9EURY|nr:DNA starvation/stationary phase protection protein DpsA [Halonotius roseus]TQQ81603.1 DNA starvation/stationary phase protection protein [Halonotius roseus]